MAERLVTIATFRDLPEAWLAKGKVESAGITAYLLDDNMVRMDWLYSNLIGGMRLQVNEDDADAAIDILADGIPEQLTDEQSGETYSQPHCPRCGSLDISFETLNKLASFGLMYFGVPVPIPTRKHWHCEDCGATWVEEEDSEDRG